MALHSKEFEALVKTPRAHEAIAQGAKLLTLQAIKLLGDEERFAAMKADFERGR